jgi:hypothetical protein
MGAPAEGVDRFVQRLACRLPVDWSHRACPGFRCPGSTECRFEANPVAIFLCGPCDLIQAGDKSVRIGCRSAFLIDGTRPCCGKCHDPHDITKTLDRQSLDRRSDPGMLRAEPIHCHRRCSLPDDKLLVQRPIGRSARGRVRV